MTEFICDICNYSTEDKSNYAKHLKTPKHLQKELGEEKKAKEYKCSECNYTCFDSSNFSKHKKSLAHRIKIGEVEKVKKVHKCGLCDYETPDWSNLYKHQQTHPENNAQKWRHVTARLNTEYHHMKNNIHYSEYDKSNKEEMDKLIKENRKRYNELNKIKYQSLAEKEKNKMENKKNGDNKKIMKKATIKIDDDDSIEDKQPKKIYKYYKTDTILDDKLMTNFKADKLQKQDYYLKYLQYMENKMVLLGDSLANWIDDSGLDKKDERALNELVDEAFDALEEKINEGKEEDD